VPRTKARQASPFWITDKSYRRCGLSQSVPVADPQTVNLSDGATHVGAVALVGNLKEAPRNATR